jgi:hypothetical protein
MDNSALGLEALGNRRAGGAEAALGERCGWGLDEAAALLFGLDELDVGGVVDG